MFQVSKGKNPIKSSHHPWSIILSKNPLQDTILVSILPITGPWLLAFCELSLLPSAWKTGNDFSPIFFFGASERKKRSKEKHLLNCFECDRWWCIWYICTHTSFIQIQWYDKDVSLFRNISELSGIRKNTSLKCFLWFHLEFWRLKIHAKSVLLLLPLNNVSMYSIPPCNQYLSPKAKNDRQPVVASHLLGAPIGGARNR